MKSKDKRSRCHSPSMISINGFLIQSLNDRKLSLALHTRSTRISRDLKAAEPLLYLYPLFVVAAGINRQTPSPTMSHAPRPTAIFPPSGTGTGSSFRQPNAHPNASQQQSSALSMRVASKRAELENLKQLRDLSGTLSSQMQALEEKLGTLRDGTEGWSLFIL